MALVGPAFSDQSDAEVAESIGVIWVKADGFLILTDGLINLAFLAEGGAKVVVRFGVIWFVLDGFLEIGGSLPRSAVVKKALPRLLWAMA